MMDSLLENHGFYTTNDGFMQSGAAASHNMLLKRYTYEYDGDVQYYRGKVKSSVVHQRVGISAWYQRSLQRNSENHPLEMRR